MRRLRQFRPRSLSRPSPSRAAGWTGRSRAALLLLWLPLLLVPDAGTAADARRHVEARWSADDVQAIADAFRAELAITEDVLVAIVPSDPRLVSVGRAKDHPGTFRLSIEEAFLATLDDDELRAVVAHEFGHIWIFTHHPFLQTEQLANRIAMRLVSRESLARVYPKVWAHTGLKGDLTHFLGQ
jgi:hypothetical protein